jgi:hypothetical protein
MKFIHAVKKVKKVKAVVTRSIKADHNIYEWTKLDRESSIVFAASIKLRILANYVGSFFQNVNSRKGHLVSAKNKRNLELQHNIREKGRKLSLSCGMDPTINRVKTRFR